MEVGSCGIASSQVRLVTIAYHNIVTGWETVATWNGRDALSFSHELEGDDPAVVLVQQAGYGPILAAARAR